MAGYMREPTKIISKAVGLFSLDPIVEEEGERGDSPAEKVDIEEGRMNEDVFEMQEEDNDEQKQEGSCVSKPPVLGAVLNVPCVMFKSA